MANLRPLAITFLSIGLLSLSASAQFVVFNNGAEVTVSQGCVVSILTGDLNNDAGSIDNSGRISVDGDLTNSDEITGGGSSTGIFNVSGDWENNDVFTADQSLVNLNGASQSITGIAVTSFYDLHLLGSDIKSMDLDAAVTGTLELNNLELATQNNIMRILNPSSLSVTVTSGFVSSTGSGRLSWDMNSTDTYVFPLGSSAGTLRIRPLALTPASSSANTFAARFANVDATSEGYDVAMIGSELCFVNDLFYYQLDQVTGSDAADITQYYNPIEDGDWATGAHWQNVPQWEEMSNEVSGTNGGYSTITNTNWSDFSEPAFALANALPDVSLASVAQLCEDGDAITLSATPAGGDYFGSGVSNGMFDPNAAGGGSHTISYAYTDVYGCTNTAEMEIEVTDAPLVTVTSSNSGALELCDGETMDLVATSGFSNYDWSPSGNNEFITVSTGGQYWVTVTDGNGCEGTSAIAYVTVQQVPEPVATPLGPTTFCEGESVTLSTATNAGSYLWDGTGSVTPTTVVAESGDYFVTVTNQYGCVGESNSINVDVIPMIVSTILVNGATLTADPPGSGYQWFINGDPIPGATGISYDAIQSGNYHVEYTAGNGCPTTTYILEYTYTGVEENSIFTTLELYPSPGKGEFTVRGLLPSTEDVTIEVTNILGQELLPAVHINSTNEFAEPIDISSYANGVYFVRIKAADSFVTVRYIKS